MAPNQYIEAIQNLDLDRIETMIERDPKWLAWSEPTGKNALHYLCGLKLQTDIERQISLAILKFLLKKGMDINSVHRVDDKTCDYFPATPLWYAYTRGRNEAVYKYLLKQGADPNHCMWAIAWYDDITAAKLFIKHGAKVDKDPSLSDLLVGAFGWKKYKFAYWLLSIGADVNAADPEGNTALIVAVKRKDEEHIAKLIRAGANADRRNGSGESARSIAASKGPKRLLNLL